MHVCIYAIYIYIYIISPKSFAVWVSGSQPKIVPQWNSTIMNHFQTTLTPNPEKFYKTYSVTK